MRELNSDEMEKVVNKLKVYLGDNVSNLMTKYKMFLNNTRVFLCSEQLYKASSQIGRKQIISVGTILGKFTKSDNFRITITGAQTIAKYGIHKVILLENGEMNFLYGNNAIRNHVYKVSEAIPINAGVFVYNKGETLLGFGLIACNQNSFQKMRSGDIVVLNQADNGEYVRNEINIA